MATTAHCGALYLIDREDGKPPHRWIVLDAPDIWGEFIAVSFTDAQNYPANGDVWPAGTKITAAYSLSKDSVLHLRYAFYGGQEWLDDRGAFYEGTCLDSVVTRARCNLLWRKDALQPRVLRAYEAQASHWDAPCTDLYNELYEA